MLVAFKPNWEPLEKCFNGDIKKVCEFMFMGTTENGINLYKHRRTRRYINISGDGKYFKYNYLDDNYTEITFPEAMAHIES